MGLSKGNRQSDRKRPPLRQSLRTSLIAASLTAFLLIFLIGGRGGTLQALIMGLFFSAVGGALVFQILRTGKVNKARLILFIGMGLFFGIVFSIDHQINRGSMLLARAQIESADVPICPITIPFVAPPLVIRKEMIFPASLEILRYIGLFWLGFALLFGRGWCSWLCFFGGIDQACAAAAKRPWLKMEGLSRLWRLLSICSPPFSNPGGFGRFVSPILGLALSRYCRL